MLSNTYLQNLLPLVIDRSTSTPKRIDSYERRSTTPSCTDADNVGEQVAVYLAELTSEMVTEMKSELREMVNAVDEIISPSFAEKSSNVNCEPTFTSPNVDWDSESSQSPSAKTVEGK